jgi:hypothetical protein
MKIRFTLTHLLIVCFVLFGFLFSYLLFSHNGLPIGWDTPRYVWQIESATNDFWGFIGQNEAYNVLYAIFGSLLVRIGATPMTVEIFLPPILVCALLLEITRLLSYLRRNINSCVVTLIALSWFAVFRMGADLHANLLALILIFEAVYNFSKYYDHKSTKHLLIALLCFFISSFTHFEVTLFFAPIIIAASILNQSYKKTMKQVTLMVLTLVPAAMLYYQHTSRLISYGGGVIAGKPFPPLFWFVYLGPLAVLSLPGLYFVTSKLKKSNSFLLSAVFTWGVFSIAVGFLQYAHPSFIIFSERAVMLYPGPFLAIFAIGETRATKQSLPNMKKIIPLTLIAIVTFSYVSFSTYNVFLTPSAYEKLQWVKQNYDDQNLILIADDYDDFAGIIGDLYDNWVRAILGATSHVYLGNVYYLYQGIPTPYFSSVSTQISNKLFATINQEVKSSMNSTIVYINDFNNPRPPPEYYLTVMEKLDTDIYVVNYTKISSLDNVIKVPMYSAEAIKGNFYTIERGWSESVHILEFWETEPKVIPCYSLLKFALKTEEIYKVSIRYWDADVGTYMRIKIDDEYVSCLNYSGLARPETSTVYEGILHEGEHMLMMEVGGAVLYAALDYVEIRLMAINETGY